MNLAKAAEDIRYLLDRGYPQDAAVSFVCSHYRLDKEAGHFLSRAVLAKEVSEKRRTKFLNCDKIKEHCIVIDGYNIFIGLESIIEKKAFICDDGVIRDIKGIFRNYKVSRNTDTAIKLILQFLKEKNPSYVCFLLDSQISKSGVLAGVLREKLIEYGLNGDSRTSKHVDYDLKISKCIVASSDGVIIDEAEKVVNFLHCLMMRFSHLKEGSLRGLSEVLVHKNNSAKY